MNTITIAISFTIIGLIIGFATCIKLVKSVVGEEVGKLKEFMKARPHDKEKGIVDSTIHYIKEVENKSTERYHELQK